MSQLPKGWAETTFGKIAILVNGRAYKRSELLQKGTPVLRIQNLNGGKNWFYSNLELPDEKYCEEGDLLYAWSATFGPYYFKGPRAIFHYHIWKLLQTGVTEKKFTYYVLRKITERVKDAAHGVAMPHMTKSGMEAWPTQIPPLNEQKRIVTKLESCESRITAAREALDEVPALLKRFRQSVFLSAINGNLTEEWRGKNGLDHDWKDTDIQAIATVGTGSTPLRSNPIFYDAGTTPWITSSATSQELVTKSREFVTDAALRANRLKKYPVGTLLVAMYGEGKTRGQVTELGIEATINQACAAIIADETIVSRKFIKLSLEANYLSMRELAEGGAQPNLNLSKIKTLPIRLPTLKEQQEVVRRVENLLTRSNRIEKHYASALDDVVCLAQSLLSKAFSGQLVPQDPTDEPASVLLARIQADRESQEPTKKAAKRPRKKSPKSS